ncbi:MAG: hypothetical protein EBE86_034665 [Hormoscilla sp. GUM202]|nr:hypothetical protein [Hormoscilla sp. GUM202]
MCNALFQTKIDGEDFLFLVQDYVKGKTYAQLLKGSKAKPLSEEEVTQLLLDILPVLSYLHSQKVLHRDGRGRAESLLSTLPFGTGLATFTAVGYWLVSRCHW